MPAGVLVDRWTDPRRTLIVAEILRGTAIAAIICVLALRWHSIPLVIVVAIVEESIEVFALLAERRYVRALVEPEQASVAQAGMEARSHLVVLAGRALGGLLFGMAQCFPFIADFLSFCVSTLTVAGIGRGERRGIPQKRASRPNPRVLMAEMRAGWNELYKDDFAFHASLFSAGMTLISQALIIVFLASAHDKRVSSIVIGSVLAMSGLGGLIGAMASRRNRRPWGKSPLKFQPLVLTVMLFVLAVSGSLMVWVMAGVMAVLGLVGAMGNVELDTYLFVKVPKEKLARVTSIEMLLDFLAASLGPALGGFLIETRGTEASIWVLLVVGAPVAFVALRLRVHSITPPAAASRRPMPDIHESLASVRYARALRSTPASGFPQAAATQSTTVASLWKRQVGSRIR
jgi:predicted MFS family arabinose efflux permease